MIDVFERNDHAGGRVALVELNGYQMECGGTIIHEKNKLMSDLADYCGK